MCSSLRWLPLLTAFACAHATPDPSTNTASPARFGELNCAESPQESAARFHAVTRPTLPNSFFVARGLESGNFSSVEIFSAEGRLGPATIEQRRADLLSLAVHHHIVAFRATIRRDMLTGTLDEQRQRLHLGRGRAVAVVQLDGTLNGEPLRKSSLAAEGLDPELHILFATDQPSLYVVADGERLSHVILNCPQYPIPDGFNDRWLRNWGDSHSMGLRTTLLSQLHFLAHMRAEKEEGLTAESFIESLHAPASVTLPRAEIVKKVSEVRRDQTAHVAYVAEERERAKKEQAASLDAEWQPTAKAITALDAALTQGDVDAWLTRQQAVVATLGAWKHSETLADHGAALAAATKRLTDRLDAESGKALASGRPATAAGLLAIRAKVDGSEPRARSLSEAMRLPEDGTSGEKMQRRVAHLRVRLLPLLTGQGALRATCRRRYESETAAKGLGRYRLTASPDELFALAARPLTELVPGAESNSLTAEQRKPEPRWEERTTTVAVTDRDVTIWKYQLQLAQKLVESWERRIAEWRHVEYRGSSGSDRQVTKNIGDATHPNYITVNEHTPGTGGFVAVDAPPELKTKYAEAVSSYNEIIRNHPRPQVKTERVRVDLPAVTHWSGSVRLTATLRRDGRAQDVVQEASASIADDNRSREEVVARLRAGSLDALASSAWSHLHQESNTAWAAELEKQIGLTQPERSAEMRWLESIVFDGVPPIALDAVAPMRPPQR